MATKKDPTKIVAYWLAELKAAKKREEHYRKVGKEVIDLYSDEKANDTDAPTPFNILYSNTETLTPALYSATPRPVVKRRHNDADPVGKLASEASKRSLEYQIDTNVEGYEALDDVMNAVVLDTLLPGRGWAVVKYDATMATIPEPQADADDLAAKTETDEKEPAQIAEWEQVCVESVVWDRVLHGYAKKWHKVPWIAYTFFMTETEVEEKFGKKIADKLTYHTSQNEEDHDQDKRKQRDDEGERKTALVYQIWDKAGGKKIRYVSPNYKDDVLKVEDDPLELTGFFNTPRPLMFIAKASSLVPTAPYKMYKTQARQLNRITKRIEKITESIKARGIYDGSLGGNLEQLMEKDDNALVPAEVTSMLATEKGFQNAIWFLPLEVLIAVLQQLYQAQETCKQTIYEITGIADIMRGATNASETLGAQKIKNQWGTLRLKRMQREVARYVRDLLRMMLELSATKLDEETWAKMTGLPFVTSAQRQQLDQQAAIMQHMQQPLSPELQQQLAQPVWGQILELLKSDLERSYRVDIETNSTIEPEAAEDQEALTKLLTALGQVMQSMGPLVLQGVLPFEAAKNMLLTVSRRYRFGDQFEDDINAMQPPKPQDDGKAQEAEMQQKMMDLDKQHAVKEIDYKKKESGMALKEQAMQAEMEHKQREMDLSMREAELKMKEDQFAMRQDVERGMLDMQKQRDTEQIGNERQVAKLENSKFKTENVVNSKADTALGQGVAGMKDLVKQLAEMVAMQAKQNQEMLAEITATMSKPRLKKAIRGKDGRIEAVEETAA